MSGAPSGHFFRERKIRPILSRINQKGLEVCYCLWGVPSRPSPGTYPGPVQVPSRVRGGPVQIRHVLCFTVFRTHPGPEIGPSRPVLVPSCSRAFLKGSGLDGQKQTSWPLPNKVFLRPAGVMDVRAFGSDVGAKKNLIFLRSERWGESFWAETSDRISARTSAGHPAQKLYV